MSLHAELRSLLLVGACLWMLGCAGPTNEEGDDPPSEGLPFGVEMTRLGTEADVQPPLHGPSLLLQGDGAPLDTAFQAHADRVADQPLDVVDSAGAGTVYGERAYLVHGDHPPQTLAPDTALTYAGVKIVRLPAGTSYDLTKRPLDRAYERSVEAGSLSANPYRPDELNGK